MQKCALAAIAAAMTVSAATSAPAQAMEQRAANDHPTGLIATDLAGRTQVVMQQVGSIGPAYRASSLRCNWTISLSLERHGRLGSGR